MSQAAEDVLRHAVSLHQSGQIDQAADLYTELLERFPNHPKLLDLLGTAELQRGNTADGVILLRHALAKVPQAPDSWFNCGRGLHQLGFHAEALACFDQAATRRQGFSAANDYRGRVLFEMGRFAEAADAFGEALKDNPGDAGLFYNRALMRVRLKQHAEALADADQALVLRADFIDAQALRAEALAALGRTDEALESLDAAIAAAPSGDLYRRRGDLLFARERFEPALADFDRALEWMPRDVGHLSARAAVLTRLNRPEAGLQDCLDALALRPDFAPAHNLAGLALVKLDRCAEALPHYDRAFQLDPGHGEIYTNNKGNALVGLNRLDEAMAQFEKSIEIDPEYAEAYANAGLIHLRRGDFAQGWPLYEWRWRVARTRSVLSHFSGDTVERYHQTLWTGEQDLTGKTILLHAEQGLGDIVQFARYLPMVRALAAKVIVETRQPILSLLETLPGDYDFRVLGKESPPPFDWHAPILSLPALFKTTQETLPRAIPYLSADPRKTAAWAKLLGEKTRKRVGLAWAGDPRHEDDLRRSIAAASLGPLLGADVEFHCLQKVIRPDDAAALQTLPQLRSHGESLHDFSDTAALMMHMDLVISVDTSIAHVAGALGLPVWILLPWAAEWRWMLNRADCPWYPTATLFRQSTPGDWDGVVARLVAALAQGSSTRPA